MGYQQQTGYAVISIVSIMLICLYIWANMTNDDNSLTQKLSSNTVKRTLVLQKAELASNFALNNNQWIISSVNKPGKVFNENLTTEVTTSSPTPINSTNTMTSKRVTLVGYSADQFERVIIMNENESVLQNRARATVAAATTRMVPK